MSTLKDIIKSIDQIIEVSSTFQFSQFSSKIIQYLKSAIEHLADFSRKSLYKLDEIDITLVLLNHFGPFIKQDNVAHLIRDCLVEIKQSFTEEQPIRESLARNHDKWLDLIMFKQSQEITFHSSQLEEIELASKLEHKCHQVMEKDIDEELKNEDSFYGLIHELIELKRNELHFTTSFLNTIEACHFKRLAELEKCKRDEETIYEEQITRINERLSQENTRHAHSLFMLNHVALIEKNAHEESSMRQASLATLPRP